MADGDSPWRPPATDEAYAGPPIAPTPDPHWRPPQYDPIPAPRRLPDVDDVALDQAERRAARVTYAVGVAALVVLVLLAISSTMN